MAALPHHPPSPRNKTAQPLSTIRPPRAISENSFPDGRGRELCLDGTVTHPSRSVGLVVLVLHCCVREKRKQACAQLAALFAGFIGSFVGVKGFTTGHASYSFLVLLVFFVYTVSRKLRRGGGIRKVLAHVLTTATSNPTPTCLLVA
jgi:uncharacterized membrane protein YtjA (UPF0391 family)